MRGSERHALGPGHRRDAMDECFLSTPDLDALPCPGNAGIDELPAHDARHFVGKDHHHVAELRALRLVDRHRVDRFVLRQPDGRNLPRDTVLPGEADLLLPIPVRQRNPAVAIEKRHVVIVARHHHRPAG